MDQAPGSGAVRSRGLRQASGQRQDPSRRVVEDDQDLVDGQGGSRHVTSLRVATGEAAGSGGRYWIRTSDLTDVNRAL